MSSLKWSLIPAPPTDLTDVLSELAQFSNAHAGSFASAKKLVPGNESDDDQEQDNPGVNRSARVTRAARFGRSLSLPP
jgi:hypothetical protein